MTANRACCSRAIEGFMSIATAGATLPEDDTFSKPAHRKLLAKLLTTEGSDGEAE